MYIDVSTLAMRNVLILSLIMLAVSSNNHFPALEREILKIWKTLNKPVFKKPVKTNHCSNKFWEIDMTKFEP